MTQIESIKIDKELRDRLPPLTKEERQLLKENIIKDNGVLYPVVVWKEESTCVDGHNRLEIYRELVVEGWSGLKFPKPKEMCFGSREEAMVWMEQNARGQRNLTEKWKEILIGREQNRRKKEPHRPAENKRYPTDTVTAERTREEVAEQFGVSPASVERYAKKARVYDEVEKAFGKDSDEAREVMTAPRKSIEDILKATEKTIDPDKAVATIKRDKAVRKAAARASTNGHTKQKPQQLYFESSTPFKKLLDKVKRIGRCPRQTFQSALGAETCRKKFRSIVDELHYMKIVEHDDDTVELVIDEEAKEICTAVHRVLDKMLAECGKGNKFKFDLPRHRILCQEMYELVHKASTHK